MTWISLLKLLHLIIEGNFLDGQRSFECCYGTAHCNIELFFLIFSILSLHSYHLRLLMYQWAWSNYTAEHFVTWLPFSLQEHLYFFTRLNVSENATAKVVASTAPLVKSRSSRPVMKKLFKDTCRWRGLSFFWLCLDQSTPIFWFRRLTLWQIFWNWLCLGQSTPIFYFGHQYLNILISNCFAHNNLHIGAAEQFYRFRFYSFPLAEHWSSLYCDFICPRNKHWLLLQSILSTSIFEDLIVTFHSPLKIRQAS